MFHSSTEMCEPSDTRATTTRTQLTTPYRVHTNPRPKEADWNRIKPIFEHLYIAQDSTLQETITQIHQSHNFTATQQMYKKRIKKWGLSKNLRQHEVEHILGITAQRQASGKDTYFTLRGRRVTMQNVHRFQRRKKLGTAEAVARYVAGRSKVCRDLRALTPEQFDAEAWRTPDVRYEDTLRAFGALFCGLVDSRYYWIESDEIVMPPSPLRNEVSDVCSSLVASKHSGLNSTVVRKIALLMESIVHSNDAWIHCRVIYILWVISTAGHPAIAQSLLTQLRQLVATVDSRSCAQHRFVHHYSSLETSHAIRLAADMISLKADMVRALPGEIPVAFKVRSLEYDVFWRQREQSNGMTLSRAMDLFKRCHSVLGPLAVETLTVLRAGLEDFVGMQVELRSYLDYLEDTQKLAFSERPRAFTFGEDYMGMEAASELARIYCRIGLHHAEAWIFERLLVHHIQTASCLRREYSLLVHISCCSELHRQSVAQAWLQRKQEMESTWQAEVESAALINASLNHNAR